MIQKSNVPGHEWLVANISTPWMQCQCGWEVEYTTREDLTRWEAHLNEVKKKEPPPDDEPHNYIFRYDAASTTQHAVCSCGWSKPAEPGRDPIIYWEGHLGKVRRKPPKKQKPKPRYGSFSSWKPGMASRQPGPVVPKKAGTVVGWSSRHSWDKIEPIAIEIFGGTYFAFTRGGAPVSPANS